MSTWRRPGGAAALCCALALSACGSDSSTEARPTGSDGTTTTTVPEHDHAASEGGDHHAESSTTYDELPAATKAEVDQVIAAYATKYPTGADAARGGWFRATRSLYGIGAHYVKSSGFLVEAGFALLEPNVLLFDGEGPDAKFAGVSYIVSDPQPVGFIGDDDMWHRHTGACLDDGTAVSLVGGGTLIDLTESECTARGGRVMALGADMMMHLWIGPEYMDSAPIFAHDHPLLFDGYQPQSDI